MNNITGMSLDAFSAFPIRALHGAEGGYNDSRDVLVTQTVDGVDLNQLYADFQAAITLQNSERSAIVDFLTFDVTSPTESVSQLSSANFERSTEYGEPRGMRQKPTTFNLGYDFGWYDLGSRFTWQYLAEASANQVDALNAAALDADNRLVFSKVLEALYTPTNRLANIEGSDVNVYALYNGDGTVPPAYKWNTHDGTHSHYLVSGAATIEPNDLDDLSEHLRHHGYSAENGVQQIVALNSREGKKVRAFRISAGATYDFIPSTAEATALVLDRNEYVAGGRPASSYAGLKVIGSYGEMLIVEDDLFVPGYVLIIGSGGRANLNNPVGFRQAPQPALRGMRLVQGRTNKYPLIDSFYNRGFGTGIRQRGGSAVMQIKASGTYTAPAAYLAG